MRMGCAVAIWMPASRLLSTGRAARPTTRPATPAEANRLTPYWRTGSNIIRAALTVTRTISVCAARMRTRTCVTCLRARRLSAELGLEARQIEAARGLDCDMGHPAGQRDEGDQQDAAERSITAGSNASTAARRERESEQAPTPRADDPFEDRAQERMAFTEGTPKHRSRMTRWTMSATIAAITNSTTPNAQSGAQNRASRSRTSRRFNLSSRMPCLSVTR